MKTTLLDALGSPYKPPTIEACGITQNVRTRGVELQRWLTKKNPPLPSTRSSSSSPPLLPWYSVATFVDTPGQELFHRLRTNGALCGDLVILVVDALEGVGKQVSLEIIKIISHFQPILSV